MDPPSNRSAGPPPDRPADAPGEAAQETRPGEPVAVTAVLPAGVALHARPAADLVRAAGRLQAPVTIAANGKRANAKSILEILALGAASGTELTISATGPGAAEAARALAEAVANLGA
jgi:phosphotransferase system HPr (HPr) family protein